MQPLCKPRAVPLIDQEPQRSSVPTKFRSAVARSGGQEPALGLRPEGRPPGRRAIARLAMDGCEPGGIPFGVGTALQPSSE